MTRPPKTPKHNRARLAAVTCGAVVLLVALLVPQIMSAARSAREQAGPAAPAAPSTPAPPPSGAAPDGMAWVPGGTFWMGNDDFIPPMPGQAQSRPGCGCFYRPE